MNVKNAIRLLNAVPILVVIGFIGLLPTGMHAATPDEVLVVVNSNSSISMAVGSQYVAARGVPNVLDVACPDSALNQGNETIQYTEFQTEIENPIVAYLASHPAINYIVLTKGIPIRVLGAPTGNTFSGQVGTSVDSLLASLGYNQIPGAAQIKFNDPTGLATGTAWRNRYWNATVPFTHAQFGGYIVTRLDGYTAADAESLVTRAMTAEQGLSAGRILFDEQSEFGLGTPSDAPFVIPGNTITQEFSFDEYNADMTNAANLLNARNSTAVDLDQSPAFIGNQTELLGYFSWGSNDPNFTQALYNSLTFAPGAIGDTAVSTSARSFFPQTTGQSMIADLITQGITGVKGDIDEPLLQSNASPTILTDRYTRGFTLGESYYAADQVLGWEDIIVGDPLAHPYSPTAGVTSPTMCSTILGNQGLRLNQAEVSCDGRFSLALQENGNLVLSQAGQQLFSSGTAGTAGSVALMQGDGNFVIYTAAGNPVWSTGTAGNPGAFLLVQDDGNLVIYIGNTPIWSSNTCCH